MTPERVETEQILQKVREGSVEEALRAAAEHQNTVGILADNSEVPPAIYRIVHGGTTEEKGWDTLRAQQCEIVREITWEEIEALLTTEHHEAMAAFESKLEPLEEECKAMLASLDSMPVQSPSMLSLMLAVFRMGVVDIASRSTDWKNVECMIEDLQRSIADVRDAYRSILHESIVLQQSPSEKKVHQYEQEVQKLRFLLSKPRFFAEQWLGVELAHRREQTKALPIV